ncbi:hypothetical protein PR048_004178 [Dryococelus australis]|uniref:Uncharacterized protein n=1 Tax=Dryococelus australis TaxID=614101 RepID=A0ABQ9I4W1_9NEOP|nr:hypothetical protein PR048_004178 [Dryococelus australis]
MNDIRYFRPERTTAVGWWPVCASTPRRDVHSNVVTAAENSTHGCSVLHIAATWREPGVGVSPLALAGEWAGRQRRRVLGNRRGGPGSSSSRQGACRKLEGGAAPSWNQQLEQRGLFRQRSSAVARVVVVGDWRKERPRRGHAAVCRKGNEPVTCFPRATHLVGGSRTEARTCATYPPPPLSSVFCRSPRGRGTPFPLLPTQHFAMELLSWTSIPHEFRYVPQASYRNSIFRARHAPDMDCVIVHARVAVWLTATTMHVGIVPDDAVGRRVFLEDFPFPRPFIRHCPILTSITLIGCQNLDVVTRVRKVLFGGLTQDGLLVAQGGGGVAQSGGGVAQRGVRVGGGGVAQRSMCDGDGGGDLGHTNTEGLLVHDGVEAVDGVGCVLDGATGAVRLGEAVAALDDVSLTALLLSLGVSGQSVLDVVGVAVGWVGVVVGVDGGGGDLSVGGGGGVSQSGGGVTQGGSGVAQRAGSVAGGHRGAGGHHGGGAQNAGVGGGHEGGQDQELKRKQILMKYADSSPMKVIEVNMERRRPGVEPSSPWWEASVLIAQPPWPLSPLRNLVLLQIRVEQILLRPVNSSYR